MSDHKKRLDEITKLLESLQDKRSLLDQIHDKVIELKDEFDTALKNAASVSKVTFNEDGMTGFKKHWWTVIKKTEFESEIRVPKMYDVNLGWLNNQDEGYNYFKVNAVTNWISEIPPEIKKDLDFQEPLDIKIDGNVITGRDIDKAEKEYGNSVKRQGDRLIIKNENYFDVIAKMIREGLMPFGLNPVREEIRSHKPMFELPDTVEPSLVKKAIDEHMKRSRTIVLLPTGFGKTFIGCGAANELKPRYLFIANKSTIPQWEKRLSEFPKIKREDYDIGTFQYAINHCMNKQYSLVVVDECQHLPADTFSQVLKIKTETLMGLSGSPFREDGRGEYLIAVFGYPIGADWNLLKNSRFYNPPTVHVWVYKNDERKFAKFTQMMETERKTLVFCDDLQLGEKLSKQYKIPFVQGSTPMQDRLKILQDNQVVIGSRVIDEGVSIIEAEVGIEIDWKGISKMQALQRAGRVMHNKKSKETEHHIVMTVDEYNKDKGRLSAYYEKGMTVIHHKESGIQISDLVTHTKEPKTRTINKVRKLIKNSEPKSQVFDEPDTEKYPLLKYKGIRKIHDGCNKIQREALLFFIDHVNLSSGFTVQNLEMSLGYSNIGGNLVAKVLKPLLDKKAIIKVDGLYRQNLSNMIPA